MNTKTIIVIVLIAVSAAAVCSASRLSRKDMLYRQFLRELYKKGRGKVADEV